MFAKLPSVLSTASREVNTASAADNTATVNRSSINKTWVGVNAPTSREGSQRATTTNSDVPPNQPVKLRTANPGNAPRAQIGSRDCTVVIEDRLFNRKANNNGGLSNLAGVFPPEPAVSVAIDYPGQAQQKATPASTCPSVAAPVEATPHLTNGVKESNGSLPRFDMSPEDKARLRAHIGDIKQALTARTCKEFFALTDRFAQIDQHFMPHLVESANISKPGLNLQYAGTSVQSAKLLISDLENGVPSGRYVFNQHPALIHFCAVDYRLVNGIPSVIAFESVGPKPLTTYLEKQLSKIPKASFLIVDMDIQRTNVDCGMFSLAFAKKLHKEQDWMKSLHERNAAGDLQLRHGLCSTPEETYRLVPPPSLYKHSQTSRRPAEYLDRNLDKENTVVNKKNETLLEFQQRHRRTLPIGVSSGDQSRDASINFSLYEKRLREYEQLNARAVEVRPEAHAGLVDVSGSLE